jgi:dihydroorotase
MMQANKQGILGDSHDVGLHPVWRSPESCLSATTRIVAIARKYGRKVHILHVTTQEEMTFLASHKDIASVEVLPNHLTLAAPDCYKRLGTLAQQNPPIREQHHQDALWQAIADGTVDIVASDHAPHTREEKAKPYPQSPSGTPGVQTMLPIMLNHVHEGRLTLERLVDVLCYGPSRLHQIACKGRIARGYDADFTIVDLQKKHTITHAQQRSKAGWTPFDGMQVTGGHRFCARTWPTERETRECGFSRGSWLCRQAFASSRWLPCGAPPIPKDYKRWRYCATL